ncbi:MAG: thioredoxin domain-containing protein [Candidatus Limnocylindria bacterium]
MRTLERRVAILGALLGAFVSTYLLVDYVFGSGICLTGSGCDVVRASPLAYPLGIPMPLLGLGFYVFAVFLLLAGPERRIVGLHADVVAAAWSLVGVVVMTVLTMTEIFVIGVLCSWCLMSAVASLLLGAGAIAAWRRGRMESPLDIPRSSRIRRRTHADVDRARHDLQRFAAATGAVVVVALVALLSLPAITTGTPAERAMVDVEDHPKLGAGPVDVVVYSDFQCPACATIAPVLSRLVDEGSISLTYRYFPLASIHRNATAAAEAAHAAAEQGRFWEFHDALFARQKAWAELPATGAAAAFEAIATEIGLDVARWRADAVSPSVSDVIRADLRSAEELQLSGTPTIFIDGVRYGGALDLGQLQRAVEIAAGG